MRNLINLTDDQIENAFSEIASFGICADDVVFSSDELQGFIDGIFSKRVAEIKEQDGFRYILVEDFQAKAGDRRQDVCVIEFTGSDGTKLTGTVSA